MLKVLSNASLLVALALPGAAIADHKTHKTSASKTIVVSCYRGPWTDVIWDRPNAIFIDSLVNHGYDFSTAHAIAERVCRDQLLVGDGEALKAEMRRIMRESPARRG
jgi:hypothetical protein